MLNDLMSGGPLTSILGAAASGGLPVYIVGEKAGALRRLYDAPEGAPAAAAAGDTTITVKVMLDERQLGEAIAPLIDKRVIPKE
jgi:hypothetical protein